MAVCLSRKHITNSGRVSMPVKLSVNEFDINRPYGWALIPFKCASPSMFVFIDVVGFCSVVVIVRAGVHCLDVEYVCILIGIYCWHRL